VGVEGEDDRRTVNFSGPFQQLLDDPPMPQMDPVEIANRHRPAAGGGRQLLKMADDMHARQARMGVGTSADGGCLGKLAIIELLSRAVNDQTNVAGNRHEPLAAMPLNRGKQLAFGQPNRYTEQKTTTSDPPPNNRTDGVSQSASRDIYVARFATSPDFWTHLMLREKSKSRNHLQTTDNP
jgi:hypothetical protein